MNSFNGRNVLETAINQYRLASELKRIGSLETSKKYFKIVIKLCQDAPVLRKIRGGAYFHLACIYEEEGDKQSHINHLKKCLAVYPEHGKAKELLSSIE